MHCFVPQSIFPGGCGLYLEFIGNAAAVLPCLIVISVDKAVPVSFYLRVLNASNHTKGDCLLYCNYKRTRRNETR